MLLTAVYKINIRVADVEEAIAISVYSRAPT